MACACAAVAAGVAVRETAAVAPVSSMRPAKSVTFARYEGLGLRSHAAVRLTAIRRQSRASPLPAVAQAVSSIPQQKIRIKLRSYESGNIEQACSKIMEAASATEARTIGPIPLPTKRKMWCVLRSPHVDKDSREHFEMRRHRRIIDLENPTAQTIDALMALDLPAGVDVEVKLK
eukprot:jgi/Chlat1/5117/Chrsp33S05125